VNALGQNGTTGGAAGPTVTVTNSTDLAHYAGLNTPYTIQVAGRITFDDMITVVANKTIVGLGSTAETALVGHSDTYTQDVGHLRVTYHHNFFDGTDQRHPRVRFGDPVHVFNNYYRDNALYGVASTMDAGVLVEGNYFENVPFPCHSASGYADSGPGRLVQRNNIFTGSGPCEVAGTVAEPRTYYAYTVDSPAGVPSTVRGGVGVGKL